MNYFGLDYKVLQNIIDDILKVGKYIPGTKVKIISNKNIKESCVVVFAWNMYDEISKKNFNNFKYFISIRDLYKSNFIENFKRKYK